VLDRFGAKATYYAAGGFCGRRVDGIDYYDEPMLRAIDAAGHEVGCHSFSHEPSPLVGSALLADDLDRNAIFLQEALGRDPGPLSFAYPYGGVCSRTKRLMGARFPSCRGIHTGVNGVHADLAQLRAIPLEQRSWSRGRIERWVETARTEKAWLVFFSHDVSETPTPYGCTPAMLDHALDAVISAGFDLAPVNRALAACRSDVGSIAASSAPQ
jgi:peptidoglycan/xylan/chitin deacetylase (PgdA/CDA1 family)